MSQINKLFFINLFKTLFLASPAFASHGGVEHHELTAWDILVKSDLLNIIILAIAIIYLGNKYLPKMVDERRKQITDELNKARNIRQKAEEELKAIQEKCKSIDFEIEQIKNEAKKTAQNLNIKIEEDTNIELEKIKIKATKEIDSARDKAIQNIKQEASEAAVKLAEDALIKIAESPNVQKKLIDDFLEELDKPSNN